MINVAYIGVIIIWTTTPLAIQWSSGEQVYMFAVTVRMAIGLALLGLIFALMKYKFVYHKKAILTYILSGVSIFISMFLVYWGAQFIPSGWIAIIFGLSPIITGVFTSLFFKEEFLSPIRLISLFLAFIGLIIIFGHGTNLGEHAVWGIGAVLLSATTHALAALLIKHTQALISGVQITYGGLLIAVFLFAMTSLFNDALSAEYVTAFNWYAIIYLGVIATAVGFPLYYFVLDKLDAIKVSMITLITPITALLLGAMLNGESLDTTVIVGASMIVLGLTMYEYDKKIARLLFE